MQIPGSFVHGNISLKTPLACSTTPQGPAPDQRTQQLGNQELDLFSTSARATGEQHSDGTVDGNFVFTPFKCLTPNRQSAIYHQHKASNYPHVNQNQNTQRFSPLMHGVGFSI